MTSIPQLLGAYATLPETRPEQEKLYAAVAERGLATGLEIPDFAIRGVNDDDLTWFANQLQGRFVESAVTAIPTTMGMQSKLPGFGLASASPDGREAALAFINEVREAAEQLNQATGEQSVAVIEIHSAPSVTADLDMFKRSLAELAEGKNFSTRLVIEHCDAFSNEVPGEKRFLSLEDEMDAAREAGLGITINWGRSVVESHDAQTPYQQIQQLTEAGLLEGLMFSGAGEGETQYGPNWGDAHLPLQDDEPVSWMTADIVRECWELAKPHAKYVGAKVQTPKDKDVQQRLDFVEHITQLLK